MNDITLDDILRAHTVGISEGVEAGAKQADDCCKNCMEERKAECQQCKNEHRALRKAEYDLAENYKAELTKIANYEYHPEASLLSVVNVLQDIARKAIKGTDGLPTTAELSGSDPDFTGGMESVQYVRMLRGDGECGE